MLQTNEKNVVNSTETGGQDIIVVPAKQPEQPPATVENESDSEDDFGFLDLRESGGGESDPSAFDYWTTRVQFMGIVEHHDRGLYIKDVFARNESGTGYTRMRTLPLHIVKHEKSEEAAPPPGTVLLVRVVRTDGDPPELYAEADLDDPKCFIAQPGSALAASYGLACGHFLDPVFPPEVMDEVKGYLEHPGLDDKNLRDLTGLAFVTIDGTYSRDLDQAMYMCNATPERGPECRWVVYYALADASYYVRPGTAVWQEALQRGASFYFPGMAIPMLPREFSEDLVSLNEGVLRRSLTFEMDVDANGRLLKTSAYRALIRSRRKLSYKGVQQFFDDGCKGELDGQDFTETLLLLRDFGNARIADLAKRNVVRFVRAEFSVYTSGPGSTFSLVADERLDCEKWNEQVSLICNIAGAQMLIDAGRELHGIWRNNGAPSPACLNGFARFVDSLARTHGDPEPRASVWHWHHDDPDGKNEPLSEYIERIQRFADEGLPDEDPSITNKERYSRLRICRAIMRHAMMTNQATEIEIHPAPHHCLGADCYARFSSPMRQIEGIFLHRELIRVVEQHQKGLTIDAPESEESLRSIVVARSRNARTLQSRLTKESNRLAIDAVFRSDLAWPAQARPVHRGTLLGIGKDNNRAYVELDNPPVEVKVYLNPLCKHTGSNFAINRHATIVRVGRAVFRVGDVIGLRVVGGSGADEPWLLEPLVDRTALPNLEPTSTPLLAASHGSSIQEEAEKQKQKQTEKKRRRRARKQQEKQEPSHAEAQPQQTESQPVRPPANVSPKPANPAVIPVAQPQSKLLTMVMRPHWLRAQAVGAFKGTSKDNSQ